MVRMAALVVICSTAIVVPAKGWSASNDYVPNDLLLYYAAKAAEVNAAQGDANEYDDRYTSELIFYSVVDAIAPVDLVRKAQKGLDTTRWMAETARTDQQIGTSPGVNGTTTLVEKAGLPRLLAAAVEHGALEQERDGTTVTLTTTPYAGIALAAGGDTAETYDRYRFWERFALSASGKIDSGNGDKEDELEYEDLSAFSFKVRVLGDRSTRSPEFVDEWESNFNASVDRILRAETGAFADTIDDIRVDGEPIEDAVDEALITTIHATKLTHPSNDRVAALKTAILAVLKTQVYDVIVGPSAKTVVIPATVKQAIVSTHVPAIFSAYQERVKAAENVKAIMEKLEKSRLLTIGADTFLVDKATNYTTLKLLYQDTLGEFDILVNADLSLNHDPSADKEDTVRDYGASVALERAFTNTITGNFDSADLSQITLSIGAKLVRYETANDEAGIVQVKADLPIYRGFTLPLAVTWSSRSEEKDQQEFRVNVGGGLNVDKLMALSQMVFGR